MVWFTITNEIGHTIGFTPSRGKYVVLLGNSHMALSFLLEFHMWMALSLS